MTSNLTRRELWIVLIIAAVQFINILDFIMVSPLAGDFALALHIPTSQIGVVAGSYTIAAGVSGLIGSAFWDRFERKRALTFNIVGLALGTLACAGAWDLWSLVGARMVAGVFGGPASALAVAIVADSVPDERRGKAMGIVMGAFSMASILGVPAGLELASWGNWRTPFIVVGGAAMVIVGFAVVLLPTMRDHIGQGTDEERRRPLAFLQRREVWLAYAMVASTMIAGFMIFPNITAYVLFNLGYPRSQLEVLYFVGGFLSLVGMQVAGAVVDRIGAFPVATFAISIVIGVIYFLFIDFRPGTNLLALFACFMLFMSVRAVAMHTLSSKVPFPFERARYMSFQSAVQHFASSTGAIVSSLILTEGAERALIGFDTVCYISIASLLLIPVTMKFLEAKVRARQASARP
ncbi:MAG: MFS transporter [Myxococcota bacterium]